MNRITRALFLLAIVVATTYAARSFVPAGKTPTGSGAALAFGFLLIAAIQFGHIADVLKSPQLTGYLICGLLFGPELMGLITRPMLADLALVKGTAVGLIALLAGCELNLRRLRPKLRAIGLVSAATMGVAFLFLAGLFYWIVGLLPVAAGFTLLERLAVTLVAANVMAAFSPAVVVGLISETRASGPLSELCMSVVVVADLAVVVTFSLTSIFARSMFPATQSAGGLPMLFQHIFGSMIAGAVFGGILAVYILRVNNRTGVFIFALLFVAAEAGRAIHLDPLLIGLTAGLVLENATAVGGEAVVAATEAVALPIFAIFFAVVGAEVQLHSFLHVAPFAVSAALVRAAGIWVGNALVSVRAGVPSAIARLVPLGLYPQAGVAIALSVLVLSEFEPWGSVVGTILLGSIVVNQLVAPIFFRMALVKSGEASTEEETPIESPETAAGAGA